MTRVDKSNIKDQATSMTKSALSFLSVFTLTALALAGCMAETTSNPTDPEQCPQVECRWSGPDGTSCLTGGPIAESSTFASSTQYSSGCYLYTSVCIPTGTRPECVPDACRHETVTCPGHP